MKAGLKHAVKWMSAGAVVVVASAAASMVRHGWLYELDGWHRMSIYVPIFSIAMLLLLNKWLLPVGRELHATYGFSVGLFLVCAAMNYVTAPYYWSIDRTLAFAAVVVVIPMTVWPLVRWFRWRS